MIIGLVLGLILAIIKIKQIPVLKQIAGLFVSIVRGTPVLVQLYIVYFGVPMFLNTLMQNTEQTWQLPIFPDSYMQYLHLG